VRRQPAVGIDLVGRKRQDGVAHGGVRRTFDGGEEEADVAGVLLDVGVGRHDDDERGGAGALPRRGGVPVGGGREEERLRRGRQAGHLLRAGGAKVHPRDGGLEKRLKG
jgi:hypothetical protein